MHSKVIFRGQSSAIHTYCMYPLSLAGERGRGRAAVPGGTLQWAAFEGRKFGILSFALQCVSVSLF